MSEALNQSGHFEPIHAAHAIEQVAFILQFDRPFDDSAFSSIRIETDQFKDDLPGKIEIQGVSFAIGAQPIPIAQPHSSAGLVLRRASPDGSVEIELRVERSSLTFVTTSYTRWDAVWAQASRYFNTLLPIYLSQARLMAVSLNYGDKFVWNGSLDSFCPNSLINSESKYISKHILETKELWHNHTGLFIRADDFTKRLLNLNVDCLDEPLPEGPRRIVVITTVVTDQLNQPGYNEYTGDQSDTIALVNTHMRDMHIFGKQVFGDLMTSQMSKRIALTE